MTILTVNSKLNRPSLTSCPSAQSSSCSNSNASELHHLQTNQLMSVSGVRFIQQPPENLRKGNFFSFSLSLLNSDHQPITVKSAKFDGFIEDIGKNSLRNGTYYKLLLKSSGGLIGAFTLFLRVVDSSNKQLVAFEGNDNNPHCQQVLLTHASTCTRCSEGKTCGNSKTAPADPALELDGTVLKFFLRCNQNGTETGRPGRPKSCEQRKFQVRVESDLSILGLSKEFFVHNSSKYGKLNNTTKKTLSPKVDECKVNTEPTIFSLSPVKNTAETELILLGENFTADFDVFIDNVLVKPNLLLSHAIKVFVPKVAPGCVKVKLVSEKKKMVKECPILFTVIEDELQSHLLDYQIRVLSTMFPANFTSKLERPLTSNIEILNQSALFIEWFKISSFLDLGC